MPPHLDLPRILRALTLMTWELLGWKTRSFESAFSRGLGGGAFRSPPLQSGAPSAPAWESCSGGGACTCEASPAGQGRDWAGLRAGKGGLGV